MSNELTTTVTPQQAAWLGLAAHKNNTVAELERRELALQSILLQPGKDKAETLKAYRAEFTALKNYRQETFRPENLGLPFRPSLVKQA